MRGLAEDLSGATEEEFDDGIGPFRCFTEGLEGVFAGGGGLRMRSGCISPNWLALEVEPGCGDCRGAVESEIWESADALMGKGEAGDGDSLESLTLGLGVKNLKRVG